MMFKFECECIINLKITVLATLHSKRYRNWNVINSQAPTAEFEHCRLSPGRIVFACFIVCLPLPSRRETHNNL